MAEQMSLHGSGPCSRAEWGDLVASLPQATAVWADLDGMHQEPLPESMPIGASHLWFWDAGRYGRVRIDGETWVAGVLTEMETAPPALCDALHEHSIMVDRATLTEWSAGDERIKQFRGNRQVLAKFVQLVPRRSATGMFLAAAEA